MIKKLIVYANLHTSVVGELFKKCVIKVLNYISTPSDSVRLFIIAPYCGNTRARFLYWSGRCDCHSNQA